MGIGDWGVGSGGLGGCAAPPPAPTTPKAPIPNPQYRY